MAKHTRFMLIPALLAGLGTSAIIGAPAAAAASPCPSNHVCGYDSTNYRGRELFDLNPGNGREINFLNDRLESVINNSKCDLFLYDWSGHQMTVFAYTADSDIGPHKNHTDSAVAGGPACP